MAKKLDITKRRYSEHILPVLGPWIYRGSTLRHKPEASRKKMPI